MSKAFTSESDNDDDSLQPPPLPPGVRNYMTREGHDRMTSEHERLTAERVTLRSTDWSEARRLKAIDRRLDFLSDRLRAAQVVDPPVDTPDRIRFGSTSTVTADGEMSHTWTIVGIDEMDLDRGKISWQSPWAAALLDRAVGETVVVGSQRWTVVSIR